MVISRLAWVTAREARGRDEDEPLALAALDRAGVSVDVVDWNDPEVDWAAYDRVALRSAWDYPQHLSAFLKWLDHVSAVSELVNPAETVRWSMDKRYLAELEKAGVPITPTAFVAPGSRAEFPEGRFVVKPAVGAGSRDAASYGPDQASAARTHVDRLHATGQVVLIQPFLSRIATEGEWPMIFFDGEFSHAASKRVSLPQAGAIDDLFAEETNASHEATMEQLDVARGTMDVVVRRLGRPAYARVDLVRDDAGDYCVLEVELGEPSLFLPYAPGSEDRFAAILAR